MGRVCTNGGREPRGLTGERVGQGERKEGESVGSVARGLCNARRCAKGNGKGKRVCAV